MPPTSIAKTSSAERTAERGLTLLEVMIVLAIIAAVVFVALGRLGGQNTQMRAAVRRLSAMTRQVHANAKLKGTVYRIVIDLKQGAKGKERQSYWIEKSSAKTILTTEEMEERKDSFGPNAEDANASNAGFASDAQLMKQPSELPGQLVIEDVELGRLPDKPFSEGKVYIYFFPQGLADEAAIHLTANEKLKWTLTTNPLTGKTDVTPEYVTLKELQGK